MVDSPTFLFAGKVMLPDLASELLDCWSPLDCCRCLSSCAEAGACSQGWTSDTYGVGSQTEAADLMLSLARLFLQSVAALNAVLNSARFVGSTAKWPCVSRLTAHDTQAPYSLVRVPC